VARRISFAIGVAAGVIIAGLIGGIAWAAIPSANGTIRACYDGGGTLKVIDEGASCAKNWKGPISWNQQGVPGVSGVHIVREAIPAVEGEGRIQGVVECPEGEMAVGGGVTVPAISDQWAVKASQPTGETPTDLTPIGWLGVVSTVDGSVPSAAEAQFRAMSLRVVCAVVP
jgi:hypothetical protein